MSSPRGPNWNSWCLVATLRSSTKSSWVMLRLCVSLNQFWVKALFARICIVSSRGTFVNNADTSYDTKISSSLNCQLTTKPSLNFQLTTTPSLTCSSLLKRFMNCNSTRTPVLVYFVSRFGSHGPLAKVFLEVLAHTCESLLSLFSVGVSQFKDCFKRVQHAPV